MPQEQELRLSDAFYKKDFSSLELIVKVRNCTNSQMLPIAKDCDILKQYCQFIEIVERTFNKRFPKRSFKKAIDTAISQGILSDYLDRKSREVTNMLCAKYDYKMDIAVKQEEAFERGVNKGAQQKAIEAARNMIAKNYPIDDICEITELSEEQVKKLYEELK
ncbi:MAG: hypothetical protein UHO11_01790 [Treponema sp.]|nr:hypothetical protein [Treponema sp.]